MDGIPESVAIGISLFGGGSVAVPIVIAVFLSNVPESLSAATGLRKAGRSTRYVLGLWTGVMLADTMMPEAFHHGGSVVGLMTVLGFAFAFFLSRLA